MNKQAKEPCQVHQNNHRAEISPTGQPYLSALHSGAVLWSCEAGSSVCHEACWDKDRYPLIWERIASCRE
jgi:hypothetical protein